MFKDANVVRYVPDKIGSGGSKIAVHSFQASQQLDTYEAFNVFVTNGRWKKELEAPTAGGLVPGTPQASITKTQSLAPYYRYSTDDASAYPTTNVLMHNADVNDTQYIYDFTAASVLGTFYTPCVPATFVNITNRMFIAWGGTQALIYNPEVGSPNDFVFLGAVPPLTVMAYALTGYTAYTNIYTAAGSPYIVAIGESPAWSGALVGKRITIGGQGDFNITGYDSFAASGSPGGTLTNAAASNVATIAGAAWGANLYRGLQLNVGADTARVASYSTSGADTTVIFQQPLPNLHAAAAYTFTGHRLQLSGNATADNWTAAANVWTGGLSWSGAGPQYAAAFFDPVTGHISNIGPILTTTEQDQAGVTVTITGLPTNSDPTNQRFTKIKLFRTLLSGGVVLFPLTGYTGQPADLDAITPPGSFVDTSSDSKLALSGALIAPQTGGYTGNDRPVINLAKTFAGSLTATNGSDLVIFVSGDQFNYDFVYQQITIDPGGPAQAVFTISAQTAADELQLSANFTTGASPGPHNYSYTVTAFIQYARPLAMAYWDGRLWMAPVQEPGLILFSSSKDQTTFGIAEESFPTLNFRHIPAQDGKVDGMRVVGDKLVITTERYAYYVAGNNETNYRLLRMSTTMYGVGTHQMEELVGEGQEEADSVVFVGRDKKVHAMGPGIGTMSISEPISPVLQSEITDSQTYSVTRAHPFAIGNRRGVIVRLDATMWIYDIERRIWTGAWLDQVGGSSQFIPDAFATMHGGSGGMAELWGYQGNAGSWLDDTSTTARTTAYFSFFDTDFNGKKSRKRLNFIRGYFSNATADPWQAQVIVDDRWTYTLNFAVYSNTTFSMIPPGATPVDGTNTVEYLALPPLTKSTAGTISVTHNSPTVTYVAGDALLPDLIGATIVINSVNYTVLAAPSSTTLTLTVNYAGGTSGNAAWTSTIACDGLMGFRFYIKIIYPENTTATDAFAIDACYTDMEEPQTAAL